MNYFGGKQAANEQSEAIQEGYIRNSKLTRTDYADQVEALNLRSAQEEMAGGQREQQVRNAGQQQVAQAANSVADQMVGGNSVNVLMQEYRNQETRNLVALEQNVLWGKAQEFSERKGLRAQALARQLSAVRPGIAGPNALAYSLQATGYLAQAGYAISNYDFNTGSNTNVGSSGTQGMYTDTPGLADPNTAVASA